MSIYESLNPAQKEAVLYTEGPLLVLAGAGSGKTRVLTHRIAYLISQKHVNPQNILAITFTNKATNEMKERVAQMGIHDVWISTFHSMCVRMLRENICCLPGYTRNFTIISESDRDRILKELIKQNEMDEDDKSKIVFHLEKIKNGGLDIEEYFDALREYDDDKNLGLFQKICLQYEERLQKCNSLDFDDLLNKTLFLFHNYPQVLNMYALRFEYILVDEFQDTNLVQYKLVKLLTSKNKNLFVVGDEDQCIYSWRGANFHNIFNLKNDFENVKVFKLERNYRSTKNIVNLANNVIANNRERLEKNLWTNKDDGAGPVVYSAFDERDEALFVAKNIAEMVINGSQYGDFAVLMRVNALSRALEEGLMAYQIPYKLFGGFKFYERAEIKVVLAYLSIFTNEKDDISLIKILNFPKRGIGEVAQKNLLDEAAGRTLLSYILSEDFKGSKYFAKFENFVGNYLILREKVDKIPLYDFVKELLERFKIRQALAGTDEEAVNKVANIDSLLAGVQEFSNDNDGATLADYLGEVMLKTDSDNIAEGGYVTLSTIHSVKGLEFNNVFVVGLEEGLFPLSRATFSASELEEERRLMYVAITRAQERIWLTYTTKRYMYGKSNLQSPSRFLSELGIVDKKRTKILSNDAVSMQKEEVFDSGLAVCDKVFHPRFGEGVIVNISDDGLVADIQFEVGCKSLMLNMAKLEKIEE